MDEAWTRRDEPSFCKLVSVGKLVVPVWEERWEECLAATEADDGRFWNKNKPVFIHVRCVTEANETQQGYHKTPRIFQHRPQKMVGLLISDVICWEEGGSARRLLSVLRSRSSRLWTGFVRQEGHAHKARGIASVKKRKGEGGSSVHARPRPTRAHTQTHTNTHTTHTHTHTHTQRSEGRLRWTATLQMFSKYVRWSVA